MAVPESAIWASEIIGFISFAITLLTLLGVYRDLISTIRNAPGQIPIQLGNLRQEIEAERLVLRKRCAEGDEFGVFVRKGSSGRRSRRSAEVVQLLMRTMDKLWGEFKDVERPFLIKSGRRAEAVRKGDFWGESDIDEKFGNKSPGTPRDQLAGGKKTNMLGMEEANVGLEGAYYYTDLRHRFIWWQSKCDVDSLMEQVQRVQIRRIERDVYEVDELMKRVMRKMDGGNDGRGNGSGSGSGSDDPGPRHGAGGSRRGSKRGSRKGGGRTVYESTETEAIKVPAWSRAGSVRAVSRAGSISRVRSISPARRRSPRLRERDQAGTASPVEQRPSNTARRRAARDSRAGDVEVVRPGRDGTYIVDVSSPRTRSRPGVRESQGQSYYREKDQRRSGDRERERERDKDRSRSRVRYDDE